MAKRATEAKNAVLTNATQALDQMRLVLKVRSP